MEPGKKYKAIIIGATGACGRELVDELLNCPEYEKITIYVRRTITRWELLPPEKKEKLNIQKVENIDFLEEGKEEWEKRLGGEKYDVVFNCLGSRVGRGDEEFKKVDYTYVVQSCELCEKLSIPHFSLVSAMNADKSSWFMYSRVKGEAEDEIAKKNVNYITIMKPGIILERDNDDRLGEKVIQWVPFIPKIKTKDIAKALVFDDLQFQKAPPSGTKVVKMSNSEMLDLVKKNLEKQQKLEKI